VPLQPEGFVQKSIVTPLAVVSEQQTLPPPTLAAQSAWLPHARKLLPVGHWAVSVQVLMLKQQTAAPSAWEQLPVLTQAEPSG